MSFNPPANAGLGQVPMTQLQGASSPVANSVQPMQSQLPQLQQLSQGAASLQPQLGASAPFAQLPAQQQLGQSAASLQPQLGASAPFAQLPAQQQLGQTAASLQPQQSNATEPTQAAVKQPTPSTNPLNPDPEVKDVPAFLLPVFHFMRAFGSIQTAKLTTSEQEYLSKKRVGGAGKQYAAWRSSAIIVLFIPLLLSVALGIPRAIEEAGGSAKYARNLFSGGDEDKGSEVSSGFSSDFGESAPQLPLPNPEPHFRGFFGTLIAADYIIIACNILAVVTATFALVYRAKFKLSRRMIVLTWLLGVVPPFLLFLCIPFRDLPNWKALNSELCHSGMVFMFTDVATNPNLLYVTSRKRAMESTRDKLYEIAPGIKSAEQASFRTKINATFVDDFCDKNAYTWITEVGDFATKDVLDGLDLAVVSATFKADVKATVDKFVQALETARKALNTAVYLIGLVLGVKGAIAMFPLAMSLMSGLLVTALKFKAFMPFTTLTGFIIMAVPIVQTPIMCAFAGVVIQTVGDWRIVVAMILFLLSFAWFSITGSILTKPLQRDDAVVAIRNRKIVRLVLLLGTLAFLIMWMVGTRVLEDMNININPGVEGYSFFMMLSNFIAKSLMTALFFGDQMAFSLSAMHQAAIKQTPEEKEAERLFVQDFSLLEDDGDTKSSV